MSSSGDGKYRIIVLNKFNNDIRFIDLSVLIVGHDPVCQLVVRLYYHCSLYNKLYSVITKSEHSIDELNAYDIEVIRKKIFVLSFLGRSLKTNVRSSL